MGFPDPDLLSSVKVRVDGSRPRWKTLLKTAPDRPSLTRPAQGIAASATRLLIDVGLHISKALLDADAVAITKAASKPYYATTNSPADFIQAFGKMAYLLIIFFCVVATRILLLTRRLHKNFTSKPSGEASNNSPVRSASPSLIPQNQLQGSEETTLAYRASRTVSTIWKVAIIPVFPLLLLLLREAFVDRTSRSGSFPRAEAGGRMMGGQQGPGGLSMYLWAQAG